MKSRQQTIESLSIRDPATSGLDRLTSRMRAASAPCAEDGDRRHAVAGPLGAAMAAKPSADTDGRPRERLRSVGSASLGDRELVSLVLRSGGGGCSAEHLAERLLLDLGGLEGLARAELSRLEAQPGLGPAKAASLVAAIEIGARLATARLRAGAPLRGPEDVHAHFFQRLRRERRESFHVVTVDGRQRVLGQHRISEGTLTASLVHPREVFRQAIAEAAAALVLVHNHPSGDPSPSAEDRAVTRRLREAGEVIGIRVLDHVVIGEEGFYSFREAGDLEAVELGLPPAQR